MLNDLLLLLIAIPLIFIAVVAAGVTVVWFIGWRNRKYNAKMMKEAKEAANERVVVGPETPPTDVVHFSHVNDPNSVPEVNVMQIVDVEFIRKALSELAEALNTTMATQQTQAHDIAQQKQKFLLIQAQVSTFDQDIRRIDAQFHAIRNPMPTNKLFSSIEDFLTKNPGKKAAAVPSINPDDDPSDIDPPDADFDADGNMIRELPTLARPEPAPPPVLPKQTKKRGKKQ